MLIVQKAVESATLMDTALVGEDTDLLILLCCHASLDSHNILFLTRTQEKYEEAQSVEHQGCQGATRSLKHAATSSFCMQSLDMILPHTCMALERALLSRSSNRVDTFENKPRCLLQSQLPPRKSPLQNEHW